MKWAGDLPRPNGGEPSVGGEASLASEHRAGQVERCGLVTNEHELGMDVGDPHESSRLVWRRPARAGLLGPEDLALASEAAWIRIES